MGFGLICSGLVLLFNPVINVFDVIPDAIGFLLIFAGLTKSSYFSDRIASARKMFMWLSVVEFAKIASIYFVVSAVKFEKGTLKLLFSFVFSAAEIGMFLAAVTWMFDGLISLGLIGRHGVTADEARKKSGGVVKYRNYIMLFLVVRCIATFVPELIELDAQSGVISGTARALIDFKPLLYELFSGVVIIMAVFYIITVVRVFCGKWKNGDAIRSYEELYSTAKKERVSYFLARRMKNALFLASLAGVLTFPVFLDDVGFLIGALPSALIIASAFVMHKYMKNSVAVVPCAVISAGVSVVSFIMQVRYFAEDSAEAVLWIEEAAERYYRMAFASVLENLASAAVIVIFAVILLKALKNHLTLCGIKEENAQYSKERHDREVFVSLRRKIITASVFGVIWCASRAAYRYIVVNYDFYIAINTVLAIIFIVYEIYTVSAVNEMVYNKETGD